MKIVGVVWSVKGRDYIVFYNFDIILENMMDLIDILKGEC